MPTVRWLIIMTKFFYELTRKQTCLGKSWGCSACRFRLKPAAHAQPASEAPSFHRAAK